MLVIIKCGNGDAFFGFTLEKNFSQTVILLQLIDLNIEFIPLLTFPPRWSR